MKHPRLSQRVYYLPLAHWQGVEVALVMDRTALNDRWSLVVLGVAYRKRVLPLTWCLLPFGASKAQVQLKLLKHIQPWLPHPREVRITLFADAEFRAVEVQAYCRRQG